MAIYSTFLQRSFDQILIDICMQKLPVIFAIDRAGNVGADGETHHGVFDLSYLNLMPNMTILAPKDGKELAEMLEYALTLDGPCAIRYPKGDAFNVNIEQGDYVIDGHSEVLKEGKDLVILAVGKMVAVGLEACAKLKSRGIDAGLINIRFVKPLDKESILRAARNNKCLVTLEDNVLDGGFGMKAVTLLAQEGITDVRVKVISWPDQFIEQGSTEELFEKYGLDSENVAERVCGFFEG